MEILKNYFKVPTDMKFLKAFLARIVELLKDPQKKELKREMKAFIDSHENLEPPNDWICSIVMKELEYYSINKLIYIN